MSERETVLGANSAQSFHWNRLKNEHLMQCFGDDSTLVQAVGHFLREGLVHGGAVINVGTAEHRAGVDAFLAKAGLDPVKLQRAGRYIPLDAEETLNRICVEGRPDRRRFQEVIGLLISCASNSWGEVRAFGEMVNLLWLEGKRQEAIELEKLWNELARSYPFTLFCAYSEDAIYDDEESFSKVCEAHSTVIL